MRILVSNDDGVYAPGIACLAKALATVGDVTVVAPDRNQSGASNSLTLERPLRVTRTADGYYSVNGTPTDSVHIAITGLFEYEPDIVVAGINSGANLGDDVVYSGTVAAATEGRFLGYPAMAVSLASKEEKHYETAAKAVLRIFGHLKHFPLPPDTILNINVPDVPFEDIRGYEITRLGNRHRAEPVVVNTDPRGRVIYWVGPAGEEEDAGEGTDFDAIRRNVVSITPLQIDLTRYSAIEPLKKWIATL
ncbi:MAG: 5'/3'-nucleotidase SurE [Gammaproteobacteria bacterium]